MSEEQSVENAIALIAEQKQHLAHMRSDLLLAVKELEHASVAYRVVAGIMVRKDASVLLTQVREEIASLDLQTDALSKQEEKYSQRRKELGDQNE